jgi:flagellar basal-body rod protein FlgF
MDNVGYISLSHAAMIERANDVTTNNIANANTSGFRAARIAFEELAFNNENGDVLSEVSYAIDKGTYSSSQEGGIIPTGNPLDFALQGEGWFAYELSDGKTGIGRDGNFTTNSAGELLTSAGHRLLDAGGSPLTIPPESGPISVATDGTMSTPDGEIIGQVGIYQANNAETWTRSQGAALIVPDGEWPLLPSISTSLVQGASEQSNVEAVVELTKMIGFQRAYERAMSLADSADKLRSSTLERLGRS